MNMTLTMALGVGAGLILLIYWTSTFNRLRTLSGQINQALGTLAAQLQQRLDLIPDVLAAAREGTKAQQAYFEQMLEVRRGTRSGAVPMDLGGMPAAPAGLALESNPGMGVESWARLQRILQDTEKDVAAARRFYVAAVTEYNVAILSVPGCLIAPLHGFEPIPDFEASREQSASLARDLMANVTGDGKPDYGIGGPGELSS